MTSQLKSESIGIDRMVERQLRNWELARQKQSVTPRQPGQQVAEFIAISRAVGLPGNEICSLLNLRLGWPVFDREILQAMSGENAWRQELYESMDERDLSWMEEFVRAMSVGYGARDDYFNQLTETILTLARKSHAIFLGRAADLVLPRGIGLRVRHHFNIEASEQARHDLIINMEVFNSHQAADIIMTALRSRGIIA